MGEAERSGPVKLICGLLAGRPEWLEQTRERLERAFGPVDLESETWPFDFTDYYAQEMGGGLLRRFFSFRELIDPENIVETKHATNRMEQALASDIQGGPSRPVNIDPGYVSLSKLVLATTKDYAHRVYLRAGIYAEATLRWRGGTFQPWEWTYPDYRTDNYIRFFGRVRELYVEQLAERGAI